MLRCCGVDRRQAGCGMRDARRKGARVWQCLGWALAVLGGVPGGEVSPLSGATRGRLGNNETSLRGAREAARWGPIDPSFSPIVGWLAITKTPEEDPSDWAVSTFTVGARGRISGTASNPTQSRHRSAGGSAGPRRVAALQWLHCLHGASQQREQPINCPTSQSTTTTTTQHSNKAQHQHTSMLRRALQHHWCSVSPLDMRN